MKKITLLLLTFTYFSFAQTFDFVETNGTTIQTNPSTGFTEVVQIIGGETLTVRSDNGDVYLNAENKVVSDSSFIWFEFEEGASVNSWNWDAYNGVSWEYRYYDVNGVQNPARQSGSISSPGDPNLTVNNTVTSDYLSKISLDYNNTSFAINFIVINQSLTVSNVDTNNLRVYPNPTKDIVNIESITSIKNIEIFNVLGKKINTLKNQNNINIENLPNGVYFLKIKNEDNIVIKQIIKN